MTTSSASTASARPTLLTLRVPGAGKPDRHEPVGAGRVGPVTRALYEAARAGVEVLEAEELLVETQ